MWHADQSCGVEISHVWQTLDYHFNIIDSTAPHWTATASVMLPDSYSQRSLSITEHRPSSYQWIGQLD